MSIKIQFASLSLGASVDQQTGSLPVFDLLEEIRSPQLPIQLQSLVIALAIEKANPADYAGKLFIHLLTPNQQQQLLGTGDMNIPADQKRMKAVFRFGGFPINQYGTHRFVLSCINQKGVKIAESLLDFEVIQVAQTQQPASSQNDSSNISH